MMHDNRSEHTMARAVPPLSGVIAKRPREIERLRSSRVALSGKHLDLRVVAR